MGANSSAGSRPHFSNPYGGHLRPPGEVCNNEHFYANNIASMGKNHVTIGSLPIQNKPEFQFSPGRSFNPNRGIHNASILAINNDNNIINSTDNEYLGNLNRVPYFAEWSVRLAESISPQPRVGHFFGTFQKFAKSYVGYGKGEENNYNKNVYLPTNEIWEFDHNLAKWRKLQLRAENKKNKTKKREEAASFTVVDEITGDKLIFVYGGRKGNKILNDLHVINLNTLTVDVLYGKKDEKKSSGFAPPSGLTGAFMSFFNRKIYIYGGISSLSSSNQTFNQTLYCYDLNRNQWTEFTVIDGIPGRANASCITFDGKMLIYGGLKGESGILMIDLSSPDNTISYRVISSGGLAPVPDSNYGRMLKVGSHLFYFGGKANNKFTLLYAYDINRNWWFVFHVRPDNETVTIEEGKVNDNGFFLVPRIHSFGCCYCESRRAIVAFLGYPVSEPPPLFILSVGEAFGVINLRNDMLDIMKLVILGDNEDENEDTFEIPDQ